MHRGDPDPSSSPLVIPRKATVGGQEHILGDVLGALGIADHTVGQAHDSPIMVAKE
jgi:hypothetical protein